MPLLQNTVISLGLGAIGAGIALTLGFPAPWLTGPAMVVTFASLSGVKTTVPDPLRDACFMVIGVTMGASVTPDVLETIARWPLSIAALGVTLLAIIYAGAWLLQSWFGFDRTTAILASTPGHLSFVLTLGADISERIGPLSIIQSVRVLALTLVVPFLLSALGYMDGAQIVLSGEKMAFVTLLMVIVLAAATALTFKRYKFPAAFLLGGLVISSVGHLAQITPGEIPDWLSLPGFMVLGILIGSRFCGVTMKILSDTLAAALAVTLVTVMIAAIAAFTVAISLDLPMTQVLLAFGPGGLEAMSAMAVLLGADPAFVAAHHVLRVIMITILLPIILFGRAGKRKSTGD